MSDPAALDFGSFVRFAVERTREVAPDADTEATALVLALFRASSAVVYDLESAVHRPHGWSWAGFRLLFVLWLTGPLDAKDAARLSGMSRQATSTLANTLERDDLLSRERSGDDGRRVSYGLTVIGAEAIGRAFREHNRRERVWADVLTPEERSVVTSALVKLLSAEPGLDVRRR